MSADEGRGAAVQNRQLSLQVLSCPVVFLVSRRLLDTEDELSDIQSDAVPSEVRDWLASTFTRQMGMMLRRSDEKPRFKSIVHAVQAGIFVER